MRRLIPLLLVLALLCGCSDPWSGVSGVGDITDQMLAQGAGNYSVSLWSGKLEADWGTAWRYTASWGELTGARRLLELRAGEDTALRAVYTPEDTGDGLIAAVICSDGAVIRLSPGDNALSLPEGKHWLVAAAYHSQGAFQVDLTLETGSLRVETET